VAVIDVVAFGSVAVLVGTFDLTSTRVHGDARPTGARRQEASVTRPSRSVPTLTAHPGGSARRSSGGAGMCGSVFDAMGE
jgi:hypothetical protein